MAGRIISKPMKTTKLINIIDQQPLAKTNNINSKFLINAINYVKGRKKKSSNLISEINHLKFNNFEPRQYDYDKLEAMLNGWEDYSEEDIHEVLSKIRSGYYTSNNSKRLNGVEIETNVAV